MKTVGIAELTIVAARLSALEERFAFVGGCALPLLLDEAFRAAVRTTFDADVIIRLVSRTAEARLDERLRALGLRNDTRPSAPRCRWLLEGITVDVMAQGPGLEFSSEWLIEGLATAAEREILPGIHVLIISPACFLASKMHAFRSRGCSREKPDYYGSRDLEDIIALAEGRSALVSDVARASPKVRSYVSSEIGRLLEEQEFRETFADHLSVSSGPLRNAVRDRVEAVLRRISQI